MGYDVFISYRRAGGSDLAEIVYQHLRRKHFKPFIDRRELLAEEPFDTQLLKIIENTPYFLLLLTPGWADRLDQPNDYVRQEIFHALKTNRKIVQLKADDCGVPHPETMRQDLDVLRQLDFVDYNREHVESSLRHLQSQIRSWRRRVRLLIVYNCIVSVLAVLGWFAVEPYLRKASPPAVDMSADENPHWNRIVEVGPDRIVALDDKLAFKLAFARSPKYRELLAREKSHPDDQANREAARRYRRELWVQTISGRGNLTASANRRVGSTGDAPDRRMDGYLGLVSLQARTAVFKSLLEMNKSTQSSLRQLFEVGFIGNAMPLRLMEREVFAREQIMLQNEIKLEEMRRQYNQSTLGLPPDVVWRPISGEPWLSRTSAAIDSVTRQAVGVDAILYELQSLPDGATEEQLAEARRRLAAAEAEFLRVLAEHELGLTELLNGDVLQIVDSERRDGLRKALEVQAKYATSTRTELTKEKGLATQASTASDAKRSLESRAAALRDHAQAFTTGRGLECALRMAVDGAGFQGRRLIARLEAAMASNPRLSAQESRLLSDFKANDSVLQAAVESALLSLGRLEQALSTVYMPARPGDGPEVVMRRDFEGLLRVAVQSTDDYAEAISSINDSHFVACALMAEAAVALEVLRIGDDGTIDGSVLEPDPAIVDQIVRAVENAAQ